MTSLEDLVTAHSPEITEEDAFVPLPPLQVMEKKVRLRTEDLLRLLRFTRKRLEASQEDATYHALQMIAYLNCTSLPYHVRNSIKNTVRLIAQANDYERSGDSKENVIAWIEKAEEAVEDYRYLRQQNQALRTNTLCIDFLRDFFGDDLLDELRYVTGTGRATVRRWIEDGSNPAWENKARIHNMARSFYALRYNQRLDDQEALRWYHTKGNMSDTPREKFRASAHPYGPLQEEMRRIGVRGDI